MVASMIFNRLQSLRRRFAGQQFLLLLLAPAAVYSFVFCYCTLPYLYLAFVRFNYAGGLFQSQFTGLKNFEFFFKSPSFVTVTGNTLKFNFINIILGTCLSLALAVLFNEINMRRFVKSCQSIILFPYFISWVAVHYFVYNVFASNNGMINSLRGTLGLNKINYYSMPQAWTWIISFIMLWKSAGMNSVIYLAAITGIDQDLYEAATIDGSSRWQNIWYITLPLLMPTVCTLVLLSLGKVFYGDFGMMYALIGDNGVLYSTTDIIDTYVYRALRKSGDPSSAMAVGLVQSVLGFIMVTMANRSVRKISPESSII